MDEIMDEITDWIMDRITDWITDQITDQITEKKKRFKGKKIPKNQIVYDVINKKK